MSGDTSLPLNAMECGNFGEVWTIHGMQPLFSFLRHSGPFP